MILTGFPERDQSWYEERFRTSHDPKAYDAYMPLYVAVVEFVNEPSNSILEVGCGTGILGDMILRRGKHYYRGFDFCQDKIAEAWKHRQFYCPIDYFRFGNAYDPKMYKGDYDTVLMIEVLEHLDDIRVLNLIPPGVLCVASVPNFPSAGHVRYFENFEAVRDRYGALLNEVDLIREFNYPPTSKIWLFAGVKK